MINDDYVNSIFTCYLLKIKNEFSNRCVDSPATHDSLHKKVGLWPCHNQGGNQYWMLSKQGEIRRDEACLDYAGTQIILYPCHGSKGNQYWEYNDEVSLKQIVRNFSYHPFITSFFVSYNSLSIFLFRRKLSDMEAAENALNCQKIVMIYKCHHAAIQNQDKDGNLANTLLMEERKTQRRSYSF